MKISSMELRRRQSWPLDRKVEWTLRQIRLWFDYHDGKVYIAFSGGKDSTVLLHLVRSLYPDVVAVFCNTGLEFPEIIFFVRETPNVIWIRPKMTHPAVIEKYGWPLVSKEQAQFIYEARTTKSVKLRALRMDGPRFCISEKWKFLLDAPFKISHTCCSVMKKRPAATFEKKTGLYPFLGTMASDSQLRRQRYYQDGCNAFAGKRPSSRPLSIWTTEDIWAYIHQYDIAYSSIYDMGYETTGCLFCAFGVHKEKPPNRFQRLKRTHPKLWRYCMDKLGMREVLDYVGIPYRGTGVLDQRSAFDKLRAKVRAGGGDI